jgi:AraC family transcriptional regulator
VWFTTAILRFYAQEASRFLAKIAVASRIVELPRGATKTPQARVLASGDGWTVSDVVCSAGPRDLPFEEQHMGTSIAVVVSGTFQYRTSAGSELMTPGSLLLGNAGDGFTCRHEHGSGDRCLSFSYNEEFCEDVAADFGAAKSRFKVPRLPPLRELSPVTAAAAALLNNPDSEAFREVAVTLFGSAMQVEDGLNHRSRAADASTLARVTRVVRMIESDLERSHDLDSLAEMARLSPYHFLRTFERLTGTTPHQYLLRMRLRRAAILLRTENGKVLDIALDCGFQDISNFNRAFRAEFGKPPRAYRLAS